MADFASTEERLRASLHTATERIAELSEMLERRDAEVERLADAIQVIVEERNDTVEKLEDQSYWYGEANKLGRTVIKLGDDIKSIAIALFPTDVAFQQPPVAALVKEIEKLKLLNAPLFSRRELEKDRAMLEWALKQGIYVSAHHTLNSRKSVATAMKGEG